MNFLTWVEYRRKKNLVFSGLIVEALNIIYSSFVKVFQKNDRRLFHMFGGKQQVYF